MATGRLLADVAVRLSGPPRRRGGPRFDRDRLRSRARRTLRELGLGRAELSLRLVDDAEMRDLNAAFRGRASTTDVLAFPLLEGDHAGFRGNLLGDVVISIDTADRQARRGRRRLDAELQRLLIHGVLHLVGHDHEEPAQARLMRAEERRLTRLFTQADP